MKPVLLIYPPYEGRFFLAARPPFPIGPLYIASYLKAVSGRYRWQPVLLDRGQSSCLRVPASQATRVAAASPSRLISRRQLS